MTTTTANTVQRLMSGLKLTSGRRYLATRPMLDFHDRTCEVTITDITDGYSASSKVKVFRGIKRQEADAFLAMFNNGETSFEGRIWS